MQNPLVRFTERAEATLGRPVDAVVPLMRRHSAWLLAGAAAYVAASVALAAAGVHGILRVVIAGTAAGATIGGLTRQHLLVDDGGELWLLAARPYRSRPDVVVGQVDRASVRIDAGKFNDRMTIDGTRYVLSSALAELAQAMVMEPTTEIDGRSEPGDSLPPDHHD